MHARLVFQVNTTSSGVDVSRQQHISFLTVSSKLQVKSDHVTSCDHNQKLSKLAQHINTVTDLLAHAIINGGPIQLKVSHLAKDIMRQTCTKR